MPEGRRCRAHECAIRHDKSRVNVHVGASTSVRRGAMKPNSRDGGSQQWAPQAHSHAGSLCLGQISVAPLLLARRHFGRLAACPSSSRSSRRLSAVISVVRPSSRRSKRQSAGAEPQASNAGDSRWLCRPAVAACRLGRTRRESGPVSAEDGASGGRIGLFHGPVQVWDCGGVTPATYAP